jgi:hypothetical protein
MVWLLRVIIFGLRVKGFRGYIGIRAEGSVFRVWSFRFRGDGFRV